MSDQRAADMIAQVVAAAKALWLAGDGWAVESNRHVLQALEAVNRLPRLIE